MDAPAVEEAREPRARKRRRTPWLGISGLILGMLSLGFAVYTSELFGNRPSRGKSDPRDASVEVSEKWKLSVRLKDKEIALSNPAPSLEKKRGLKDFFSRKEEPKAATIDPAPPATTAMPPQPAPVDGLERTPNTIAAADGWLPFVPITGGFVASILGALSWIRREDHRISGSAIAFAVVSMAWQWVAMAVAAVIGLWILVQLFKHSDFGG